MSHTIEISESTDELREALYTWCSAESNREHIEKQLISHLGINGISWYLSRQMLRFWLKSLTGWQLAKIRVLLEPTESD